MQLEITNYRGVAKAKLDLSRICLVAGPNEAGKTSTAQAAAAALTGEAVPIIGVKKASAGLLVRSGTARGSVTLEGSAGKSNIIWPSAKVKTEGQAPFASHFAAGMQSIVTLEDKDRVKILTEYLKAQPTREDMCAQLASMNLPEKVLDQLWELIETQGWDNAHEQIKQKGSKLKGQWQEVTGENYGSKKAESWIPPGYESDLMGMSESTLKAVVTDSQDALEASIASGAVEDYRRGDLEALAATVPERTAEVEKAKAMELLDPVIHSQLETASNFVAEMQTQLNDMEQELRAMPQPDNTAGTPCPACGVVLEIHGKTLTELITMDAETKVARQSAIDAMTVKINVVRDSLQKHQADADRLQQMINRAENEKSHNITAALRALGEATAAVEQLAALPTDAPKQDMQEVERCRCNLATAQLRLSAFQKKYNADRLHSAIGQNQELIDKVAPEGIRGTVLERALAGFNIKAEPLCAAGGWRLVALEPDFTPTYGGTPYLLLSESAKWRVRLILQMVMALIDGSNALIIDAADILDKGGRNGLFRTVATVGLPTLICMTMDARELVPNLSKAGLGVSYWMDNATAEQL